MSGCCNSGNLLGGTLVGPAGRGVQSITVISVVGGQNITINYTDGTSSPVIFIPNGTNGLNGQSVTHVAWTSNTTAQPQGTPGTTDVYTTYIGPGATNPVGTFQVTNGTVAPTITMTNVGTGKEVYVPGSMPNAQYRTILSSLGRIEVGYASPTEIDLNIPNANYVQTSPSGTPLTTSASSAFSASPGSGFSSVGNASGFFPLQFHINQVTKQIHVKGCVVYNGGAGVVNNPTGSATQILVEVCQVHSSLIPANAAQQAFFTVNIFGTPLVNRATAGIFGGTLFLILSVRQNSLIAGNVVSFDGGLYAI